MSFSFRLWLAPALIPLLVACTAAESADSHGDSDPGGAATQEAAAPDGWVRGKSDTTPDAGKTREYHLLIQADGTAALYVVPVTLDDYEHYGIGDNWP